MEEVENSNTNPFDLFTSECNDIELQVRINAIKKLTTVAIALDREKTRTELIPFLDTLTEGIYNDDEVLLSLGEELGNFLPYVGGTEYAHLILNILEKLASIEENLIREKAIESLHKIIKVLDTNIVETAFIPLVIRLADSEWFTSKSTSTALFSICYPRVSGDIKTDLRNVYRVLCQDDSPLVRRSAAGKLTEFARVLELQYLKDEFIPVFDNFSKDDQDSVRVLAVDVGISIATRLKKKEVEEFILTTLTELCGDASWRVRYRVAYQINLIQTALGYELTRKYLVAIYQNLIHDGEPQVREASAKNIVGFCEILQQTYIEEHNDEQIDPAILNEIFPLIQYLDQDVSPEVKEALSMVITSLSPLLGVENTKTLLLPLITNSLLNDSSRVRENIISNLNNIISVIGISDIADTVLKIVFELVNNSASVWRTRRNLIVTINYIAKQSGKEYFDTNLKALYQKLLSDGVYAVRKTAPLILPILIKNFGFKWASSSVVPLFLIFSEHRHYLYRFVCLFCIDELVTPTLESKFESATTADDIQNKNRLMYLQQVRNIIVNQAEEEETINKTEKLLKRLNRLNKTLKIKLNEEEWILNALAFLDENDVAEDDIKKYAEDTIEIFKRDNNLDIMNVSRDEIILKNDDVYLEGVLDLILNKCLTVLRSLYKDPVPNVQLKVAKTVKKIATFNKSLEAEFEEEWARNILKDDPEDDINMKEANSEASDDVSQNDGVEEETAEKIEEKPDEITNEETTEIAEGHSEEEVKVEKSEEKSMETELIKILEEKLSAEKITSNNQS
ncbi:hypothetical protein ILUMI_22324 [Ignelater luminosus]|uniref:Phosphatase PP2A regulatory subunit A/Splicing factor 3B subunit 1-like HEAT repeat domain-containing protein n=1 Tax=Ignelater luminosus TaxID=2038154 RepID=A0A8K0CHC5_IGNLU|nr:hypothetical protein ILUMI_22324 [Ignelater luminosus]